MGLSIEPFQLLLFRDDLMFCLVHTNAFREKIESLSQQIPYVDMALALKVKHSYLLL